MGENINEYNVEVVNIDTTVTPTLTVTPSPTVTVTPTPTVTAGCTNLHDRGLYFKIVTKSGNEITSEEVLLSVYTENEIFNVKKISCNDIINRSAKLAYYENVKIESLIFNFKIIYYAGGKKYTLSSVKYTDRYNYTIYGYYIPQNEIREYIIVIDDEQFVTGEYNGININVIPANRKLFYELEGDTPNTFINGGISKNAFGIQTSKLNSNYATLYTHGKQIGLSYDDLQSHIGIPIIANNKVSELRRQGKLPAQYITVDTSVRDIYNTTPDEKDIYLNQMLMAIRTLQSEIRKLKNTFKYGIESYQGKHTAMSDVIGDLSDVEAEEPLWAVTEDSLSEISGFQFNIGPNHSLQGGTVNFESNKLIVKNPVYYIDEKLYRELTDSYIYFFITTNKLNFNIVFKNSGKGLYDKEITLDFTKLCPDNTSVLKNILVVISRAHTPNPTADNKKYYGYNYIYTSINYWDSNKTIKSGYISESNPYTLYDTPQYFSGCGIELEKNIYYPYMFNFSNMEIYKLNAYTKYKDFSNGVLPTLPNSDEEEKYKVAHLTIRGFDTLAEAKEVKDQLLDMELFFIGDKNKLYIKNNGNIIGISGGSSTDTDDEDTGFVDTTMTQEELISMLIEMGIVYEVDGTLSMSNISDVTFINQQTGKKFNFECNPYGELVGTEIRTDTIEDRLKSLFGKNSEQFNALDYLSPDFENYRGTVAQLRLMEDRGTDKILLGSDAGQCADRVKIGAFYCPLKDDKVFGATHGYIELVNASDRDLNLQGCYLHYCFVNVEGSQEVASLALTGVLPAGGSYLVRCKQYANMDDNNAFIKVTTYDQEWYYINKYTGKSELLDLTVNDAMDTSDPNNPIALYKYGLLLTYGNTVSGQAITSQTICFDNKGNSPNETVKSNANAKYSFVKGFIDAVSINKDMGWAPNNIKVISNSIIKQTFMMDPAKQALNGLFGKDSSRIRWANNTNDIQYVNLGNEYISFKHSDEIYPVANFTPKASFENKNVCTDKTQLNKERPNMVYTAFGINNLTTRCFSWTSIGVFNEYIWIKTENENEFTKLKRFESYKEISEEVSMADVCPRRKEFPVELNNAAYARIIGRFPADNSQYCTHKCIVEVTNVPVSAPVKYEYIVGRADKDGNPDLLHCSEVMSFTLYPESYKPIIYHTSDQQGFHWIEYQVWNAAANKLEEKIKADCEGKEVYPVIINTGDMTQNGTRINEWLDYYNGGKNLFSKYEHAAVVGNNDLCDIDPTILGTGDDIGKSNSYFFNLFFCYEIDITKDETGEYNIPLPICHGKYIPSLYYFNIGQNNRLIMMNSEITEVTCRDWYNINYKSSSETSVVNIYTGFTIQSADLSVYVADKGDEIGGSFTPIYEMIYKMTSDNQYNYIAVCHESPFTVITYASLKPTAANENRSLSGSSLVGCHMNVISSTNNNGTGMNWLSRLLEYRRIKLCLCGHKHTYASTYPIRENFKYYTAEGWKSSADGVYTMPPSLKEEYGKYIDASGAEKTGNLINWVWDEIFTANDGEIKLTGAHHTKFPLIGVNKGDYSQGTSAIEQVIPCQYVEGLTNGVIYFMCQATGYKLTSNKELPSQAQKFSEFIPQTKNNANGDKPDGNQRRPMFAIITIDNNNTNYSIKLARIENILTDKFIFTQSSFNSGDMKLQYLIEDTTKIGFGKWQDTEDALISY